MYLAAGMLAHPVAAVLDSGELLRSSVAAASAASVLTSLVKRTVQFITAATSM
jgi:hypothetical protein